MGYSVTQRTLGSRRLNQLRDQKLFIPILNGECWCGLTTKAVEAGTLKLAWIAETDEAVHHTISARCAGQSQDLLIVGVSVGRIVIGLLKPLEEGGSGPAYLLGNILVNVLLADV